MKNCSFSEAVGVGLPEIKRHLFSPVRNVPEISWVFRRVYFGGWQGSEIGA